MNIRNLVLVTYLLLSTLLTAAYPAGLCLDLFASQKSFAPHELEARQQIIKKSHTFQDGAILIEEMTKDGSLIYIGDHEYSPGTEFLASNEFDWAKKAKPDHTETDVIIGFGTNNVWDIALTKKAKHMVIGDWSPWPVVAQRYLVQPLIRISKTPQELILQLAGIPKEIAKKLTIEEAFQLTRQFDSFPINRQAPEVLKLLNELAHNTDISEIELKFLTTYFRPRLGDNISFAGFGPFQQLRHPSFALLHSFYSKRYSPDIAGEAENVFSSQQNFQYLKDLFDSGNVSFGITSVNDMAFYQKVKTSKMSESLKRITLSVTNIFDCGCYNGLTFSDFRKYIKDALSVFKSPVTIFRTTNNVPPHGYYKYEIKAEDDIPKLDEFDSSALEEYPQAG